MVFLVKSHHFMKAFSCYLLFMLTTQSSIAETLKLNNVLTRSAEFYPDILSNREAIKAAKTQILKAEGAFDTILSQDLYTRPDGYYDGNLLDTRIEQPIPDMNAKFYTGYRIADGIFPIYENSYETHNHGEYYIGAKLSLLRDRMINKKTASLSIAELKTLEENINLILKKLDIQKNATQKYWEWVTAGHQYYVYQDLLNLAEKRQQNLKKHIEHGNLAPIYLQENQQYLLKRQGEANMARASYDMAAQELSLYYRDEKGKPLAPSLEMLPENMPDLSSHILTEEILSELSRHPAFKILATQRRILHQKKHLSENDLLPYFDVNIKASQDIGDGSKTRDEAELTVYLNMTLPLDRTIAKSDKAFAEAKLQELSYKEQMQQERLHMAVKNLLINMNNQKGYLEVTAKEYSLSQKMLDVEEQRFEAGVSDFFTLNKREEDMIKIRLQRLKAQENYLKMHTEIKALTASLDPVFDIVN